MKKYGLIGYPLGHSFSKNFFNEKFHSENIDAEYVNFEIPSIKELPSVLLANPDFLILDEPTAGLDPGGRDEIFELITKLHENNNMTIILSSHSMDDMAKLAKNIIVMNHGKIEFMGSPREVFNSNVDRLKEIGLDVPQVLELAIKLREKGFNIREDILTIEEAKEEILKAVKGGKQC